MSEPCCARSDPKHPRRKSRRERALALLERERVTAVLSRHHLDHRLLGHPVLMWIGLISYGLLLWNVTIAVLLGDPGADESFWTVLIAGTIITLPLATLSYYLIERPLMKFKYRSVRAWLRQRRDGGGPALSRQG